MNNTIQMYDAQADSIKVKDIAANVNNRTMLMRRNNANDCNNETLYIIDSHDDDGEECIDYVPEGAYDMGWLGYFIGRNDQLKKLYIRYFDSASIDIINSFFQGVRNNRSITRLDFCSCSMNLLDGKIFTMMSPFFENNNNLSRIIINDCTLRDDGWRLLALALGSSKHKSLEDVSLMNNNISDEAMVDIITALSMHPHLQVIDLSGNQLQTNGCKALATLLQNSVTQLQYLDLGDNELDDESISSLVPALKNCHQLQSLTLSRNESITSSGWQQFASILEPPTSNLTTLRLVVNGANLDDEIAAAFVDALKNNCRLTRLYIGDMSNNIQASFSNILCDTSSINSTFLSNHTLFWLGESANRNQLRPLLVINKRENKKEGAMIKILQNHNDFDMMPFFEWEFKVLPLMINWYERASSKMPVSFGQRIRRGKLSSIYQFVRGMPLLYVETYLRKELEDIKAARKQKQEKQRELEEEIVILEERQNSIMKRLGQQRGIPA